MFVVVPALISVALVGPAEAQAARPGLETIRGWNQLALASVRATRASDADAARLYALLNVAMYDAVNGLNRANRRTPALVSATGPHGADAEAAAAAAGHEVMVRLDEPRKGDYDARLATDLARVRPGPKRNLGVAWGQEVGRQVVTARADDGSSPPEVQPGGTGPGVFPSDWSGVQYRNVRPFAVADTSAYVLGPPPALDSLDYAAAFAEVALLGNANIAAPDKLATFQFWSVSTGTDQPPGEWIKIAVQVAGARSVDLTDGSRLLALLTMAMVDSNIATVGTKFAHRHWRPTTAIVQADTDGNPLTVADGNWRARAGSPGSSPEWVSGHSSFSGTAATVLAGFFCADRIPFALVTDSAPGGQERRYPSFSAAAAEAGRSRIFGGQHFEFSNQAGLALGRAVGAEVLHTSLLLRTGATHFGECPK
jgi:hypothetical protein